MNARITEMTIQDYDQALALWQSTQGVGLHVDDCDSRDAVARYLARNKGLSLVAWDGTALVGAVLCGHDGRRGYLNHLAVAKTHRRQGLATALVGRCLAGLAGAGITKCNLFVYADNHAAIAFWRRLGWGFYEDVGVRTMSRSVSR